MLAMMNDIDDDDNDFHDDDDDDDEMKVMKTLMISTIIKSKSDGNDETYR